MYCWGLLTLELLKRGLLVEEVGESDEINFGKSYIFIPQFNIALLKHSLTHFSRPFFFTTPAFLAMVIALGACLVRRDPQRYLALYLVELSLLVCLFLFGRFDVTRLYLIFIPFVVISAVLLSRSKNGGTKAKI